jgi:hypothetical protein
MQRLDDISGVVFDIGWLPTAEDVGWLAVFLYFLLFIVGMSFPHHEQERGCGRKEITCRQ